MHDREYSATNRNAAATLLDVFHHTTGPLDTAASNRQPGFTYVCLDMDDRDDVLEWDPGNDSAWTHSPEGRSVREWSGSIVSLGREPGMRNMFSLRARDLRMSPGSTLHAKRSSAKPRSQPQAPSRSWCSCRQPN